MIDYGKELQKAFDDGYKARDAEIVRCKDCKWAEVDAWWTYCKLGHAEDTPNSTIYTCAYDFFCADGIRKEQEDE